MYCTLEELDTPLRSFINKHNPDRILTHPSPAISQGSWLEWIQRKIIIYQCNTPSPVLAGCSMSTLLFLLNITFSCSTDCTAPSRTLLGPPRWFTQDREKRGGGEEMRGEEGTARWKEEGEYWRNISISSHFLSPAWEAGWNGRCSRHHNLSYSCDKNNWWSHTWLQTPLETEGREHTFTSPIQTQ